MSNENSGVLLPVRIAFAEYIKAWYAGLFGDTTAMQEYVARGADKCVMFAPGRMVDDAEKMLEMYRKANIAAPGANSLLPVVLVAMAKDWTLVESGFGHQVGDRQLVSLTEDADASVYGYRQAMGEIRTQFAIFAPEEATAKSIAMQLALYLGAVSNRRFRALHTWGQYTLPMPVMIETPEINFVSVQHDDQKNLTILAADVILRTVVPFLDAPKAGEPNDGSSHNPPGYPLVVEVDTEAVQINPNVPLPVIE